MTPNIAPEASQFFDPDTQTGPATQEAGRVAAMAIDPACAPGDCQHGRRGCGRRRLDDRRRARPPTSPGSRRRTRCRPLPSARSTTTPPTTSSTPARASPTARATPRPGSACSGRPTSAPAGRWFPAAPRWRPTARSARSPSTPNDPDTIYIGTALARHGSSSVNGGRRTPPNAPTARRLPLDRRRRQLQPRAGPRRQGARRPDAARDRASTSSQGGISKLIIDPNHPNQLYAAVFGYGIWRADQSPARPDLGQVFHTMNQNDFTGPTTSSAIRPVTRPSSTSSTSAVARRGCTSATPPTTGRSTATIRRRRRGPGETTTSRRSPATPTAMLDPGRPDGRHLQHGQRLESSSRARTPPSPGFAVYNYCQNGQCSYDSLVVHPPGSSPDTVWYVGSMNYDELKVYDRDGLGAPPRSNGRALIRSTNAGGKRRRTRLGAT